MKKFYLVLGIFLLILAADITARQPVPIVIFLYLIGAVILIMHGLMYQMNRKILNSVVIAIFMIPVFNILAFGIYGSIQTTDFNEDVVFVLGAGLVNDEIQPILNRRLLQAVSYFEKNPDSIFIVCGGLGINQTISEARAMANFLIENGIPESQVLLEDKSTNTFENFKFAIEILENHFPNGFTSVIITNNFHQYRSSFLARYLSINPNRYPAQTPFFTWHRNYPRELLAIINTWVNQTSN